VFNTSTVARDLTITVVGRLPATTRWVGVVAAAERTRLVGIGGRTSSHGPDKLSKALVAVPRLSSPPTVVSTSLTTAKAKYSYLHSGSSVHLFTGTEYEYTLWPQEKYAVLP
jgi:hypothetical protein